MGVEQTTKFAELTELCRTAMGVAGRISQPEGSRALYTADQSSIREKVERFDNFTPDNDPFHEHDFGSFEAEGETLYFKIDYFDSTLMYHSPDPADPSVTERVITIMLDEEY